MIRFLHSIAGLFRGSITNEELEAQRVENLPSCASLDQIHPSDIHLYTSLPMHCTSCDLVSNHMVKRSHLKLAVIWMCPRCGSGEFTKIHHSYDKANRSAR